MTTPATAPKIGRSRSPEEMALPGVPEDGELPSFTPSTHLPPHPKKLQPLHPKKFVQFSENGTGNPVEHDIPADLKMQIVSVVLRQKSELQDLAEEQSNTLISTIDDVFSRLDDHASPTAARRNLIPVEPDGRSLIPVEPDGVPCVMTIGTDGGAKPVRMTTPDGDSPKPPLSNNLVMNGEESCPEEVQCLTKKIEQTMAEDVVVSKSCPTVFREKVAQLVQALQISKGESIRYQLVGNFDAGFWDTLIGFVIVTNGIVMMMELEWKGWVLGAELGQYSKNSTGWGNAQGFFDVSEHIFTLIFLIELIIKVVIYRRYFLNELMNMFDMFLVCASVLNMYILPLMQGARSNNIDNLTFLRIMRMARLMRTFRMLRTLKLFSGLRVLIKSVGSCILSLMWSMILLTIFMMMGAIVMASLMEEFITNEANEMEHRVWTWTHYGTTFRATYTMFEVTLSGCWPNYARPILQNVGWIYVIFFVIYVTTVVFAIIRIISAIFLKETMDAANSDVDMLITERHRKKKYYLDKLDKVFKVADDSNDGLISEDEFNEAISVPIVKSYFSALELDVHEGQALFQLLDDGDGQISREEFRKGVMLLKGQARSIDLISVQRDAQKILEHVKVLTRHVVGEQSDPGVPIPGAVGLSRSETAILHKNLKALTKVSLPSLARTGTHDSQEALIKRGGTMEASSAMSGMC